MFSKNKRKVKQRNYYNPFYMFGYLSVGDGVMSLYYYQGKAK